MLQTDTLESAIRQELARVGTCTLDELNERLPYYSWNQVFAAVDRLNREGTVTLQRPDSLGYILSLSPRQSAGARFYLSVRHTQSAGATDRGA
jgi:hypothetical protein